MTKRLKVIERIFPALRSGDYEKNSRESQGYNCIAFAAGDVEHFWDGFGDPPDGYWPSQNTGGMIEHLVSAYEADGFEECTGPNPEPGYEKVVLYKQQNGKWTHAARLREDGWWESKLGKAEDIIHRTPQVLEGGLYGKVALFMRRRISDRLRSRLVRWLARKKAERKPMRLNIDEAIERLRAKLTRKP